jgi:hypothetical protein
MRLPNQDDYAVLGKGSSKTRRKPRQAGAVLILIFLFRAVGRVEYAGLIEEPAKSGFAQNPIPVSVYDAPPKNGLNVAASRIELFSVGPFISRINFSRMALTANQNNGRHQVGWCRLKPRYSPMSALNTPNGQISSNSVNNSFAIADICKSYKNESPIAFVKWPLNEPDNDPRSMRGNEFLPREIDRGLGGFPKLIEGIFLAFETSYALNRHSENVVVKAVIIPELNLCNIQ